MRYALAISVLGALIALHVLGHVWMARAFGVRLKRFVIGFGPAMFTLSRGGTDYVLAAIPLGGAAVLRGSNPYDAEEELRGPGSFLALSAWKRFLVHAAGPLMNGLIAAGLLIALYMGGTHVPVPLTVGIVVPGSEAARATLRPGDVIHSVEGAAVTSWSDFVGRIANNPDTPLTLGLVREGQPATLRVVPRADAAGTGRLGVRQQYVHRAHPFSEAASLTGTHLVRLCGESARLVFGLLLATDEGPMLRPLEVSRQASHAAAGGWDALVRVVVALSVLLGLVNLLPLPGLDGGRMLLTGIEAFFKKKLPVRLETLLHTAGLLGMLALILVLALGDARGRLLAVMGTGSVQPSEDVTGEADTEPALPLESPDAGE